MRKQLLSIVAVWALATTAQATTNVICLTASPGSVRNYQLPSDWTNTGAIAYTLAGGGNGGLGTTSQGGGGGGAGQLVKSNVDPSFTASQYVSIQIGAAGGGFAKGGAASTWICNTSSATSPAPTCDSSTNAWTGVSGPGNGTTSPSGSNNGSSGGSYATGTFQHVAGSGGTGDSLGAGGGGGAASTLVSGGVGGSSSASGGGNGGSAGSASPASGGAGATSSTVAGNGGTSTPTALATCTGGDLTPGTVIYLGSGGGGGSSANPNGGSATTYGGAGGGAYGTTGTIGHGYQGLLILEYTPYVPPPPGSYDTLLLFNSGGFLSGGVTPVNCPYPTGGTDGCSASQGGNFSIANAYGTTFQSHAIQSGQTWAGGAHPWSWNSAAVDYPVGYYSTTLANPLSGSGLPNGCAQATSLIGTPEISCTGSGALTISGFDSSSNGLHNCVAWDIGGNYSSITVTNNKWGGGTGCSVVDNTAQGFVGTGFNGYILASSNIICVGTTNQGAGAVLDDGSHSFDLGTAASGGPLSAGTYLTASGGGSCAGGFTAYTMNQAIGSTAIGSSSSPVAFTEATKTMLISSGTSTVGDSIQGGVIGNGLTNGAKVTAVASGVVTLDTAYYTTGTQTFTSGRYALGDGIFLYAHHGGIGPTTFTYNYADADAAVNNPMAGEGFALWYAGDVDIEYNALRNIPGRPIALITNGQITAEHNYVENFVFDPAGGHAEFIVNAMNEGTMTGKHYAYNVILQGKGVLINGGESSLWLGGSCCGDASNNTITNSEVDHNITVINCGGGPCTPAIGNADNRVMSYSLTEVQAITYTNINIHDNYTDSAGAIGVTFAHFGAVCTNPATFAGNFDLISGNTTNAWTTNGATGC